VADQKTSEILGAYHRLEKVWSHVRPKMEREREKQIDKQRHRDRDRATVNWVNNLFLCSSLELLFCILGLIYFANLKLESQNLNQYTLAKIVLVFPGKRLRVQFARL
jgi:hypothetical protein